MAPLPLVAAQSWCTRQVCSQQRVRRSLAASGTVALPHCGFVSIKDLTTDSDVGFESKRVIRFKADQSSLRVPRLI